MANVSLPIKIRHDTLSKGKHGGHNVGGLTARASRERWSRKWRSLFETQRMLAGGGWRGTEGRKKLPPLDTSLGTLVWFCAWCYELTHTSKKPQKHKENIKMVNGEQKTRAMSIEDPASRVATRARLGSSAGFEWTLLHMFGTFMRDFGFKLGWTPFPAATDNNCALVHHAASHFPRCMERLSGATSNWRRSCCSHFIAHVELELH